MGRKFSRWRALSPGVPATIPQLHEILLENRAFTPVDKLDYGDHGLTAVVATMARAIHGKKRIALYADYDVDGTMSCVSWIWFLQAVGHRNYVHYIPCRFKEGYGVNLAAIRHLVEEEGAEVVITMDTGITANAEAAYCRERGVEFLCTDHHKIQPEKMPDCLIVNPKLHPDERYQELCGCGITFVLLRKLAEQFPQPVVPWAETWTDLLALTGMATICDVVPLNPVNHRLAKLGVESIMKSRRPVLKRLREASAVLKNVDETDIGFRLGPRINAVGRLEHADIVVRAFLDEDPEPLVAQMGECNDRRKIIQKDIVAEARTQAARFPDAPVLFLGGDWHPGVVGIAASKIAEEFWRPTWLFQRKDGVCKGSARSIPGFDVTEAMASAKELFLKFGGHTFAGGFTFEEAREAELREALENHAAMRRRDEPEIWQSRLFYDCALPADLLTLELAVKLEGMRPFGNGFTEPRFLVAARILGVDFYRDKDTGEKKHTAVTIAGAARRPQKVMFFNEVHEELQGAEQGSFIVAASKNVFRGNTSLSLIGSDFDLVE